MIRRSQPRDAAPFSLPTSIAAPAPAARQRVRFCTTPDGVRLAYATAGRGAPLVKVANRLSHIEMDWDSPLWRHWLDALSCEHQLVYYDGRGCGLSDRDIPPLTFESWVMDLETVVDALGLERFPLLGISRGAPVAIAYATRHPERVSHLILQGGYARGRLQRGGGQQQRDHAELTLKLVELGWTADNPAARQFFATKTVPDGTSEQHRSFNEIARMASSAENALADISLRYQTDVTKLASEIACPTLIFHSTGDELVPFEEGRTLACLIPGAKFVTLASRNHFLVEHEPAWQMWLDELRHFLPPSPTGLPGVPALTTRQRELVELVARGLNNNQIASALGLSVKTVKNHLTHVFAKLEVTHRSQAIVRARDAGFGRHP